jgi:hypothetical protein
MSCQLCSGHCWIQGNVRLIEKIDPNSASSGIAFDRLIDKNRCLRELWPRLAEGSTDLSGPVTTELGLEDFSGAQIDGSGLVDLPVPFPFVLFAGLGEIGDQQQDVSVSYRLGWWWLITWWLVHLVPFFASGRTLQGVAEVASEVLRLCWFRGVQIG